MLLNKVLEARSILNRSMDFDPVTFDRLGIFFSSAASSPQAPFLAISSAISLPKCDLPSLSRHGVVLHFRGVRPRPLKQEISKPFPQSPLFAAKPATRDPIPLELNHNARTRRTLPRRASERSSNRNLSTFLAWVSAPLKLKRIPPIPRNSVLAHPPTCHPIWF